MFFGQTFWKPLIAAGRFGHPEVLKNELFVQQILNTKSFCLLYYDATFSSPREEGWVSDSFYFCCIVKFSQTAEIKDAMSRENWHCSWEPVISDGVTQIGRYETSLMAWGVRLKIAPELSRWSLEVPRPNIYFANWKGLISDHVCFTFGRPSQQWGTTLLASSWFK